MTPEHIRIAQIGESLLSEPEKNFTTSFDELLEISAKKDHVRDQALLTAALVLSDILPNYRVGHEETQTSASGRGKARPTNQVQSTKYKSEQVYEEKLTKAVKTLVGKLKTRGLVKAMGLLLETGSPLVLGPCGEQLVDALVGAAFTGKVGAAEILKKFAESDVELELSVKLVRSITRQKIPKIPCALVGVLERVQTDQGLKAVGQGVGGLDKLEDDMLRRDLLVSSTQKDMTKIKNNEVIILREIITFCIKYVRMIKNGDPAVMCAVLRALRVHALHVNVELSREIVQELRVAFLEKKKVDQVMFEMFSTLLVLLKKLESVSEAFSTTIFVGKMIPRLLDSVAKCPVDQLTFLATELTKLAPDGPLETQEQVAEFVFKAMTAHPDAGKVFAAQLFTLFARGKLDIRCELDKGGKFHEILEQLEKNSEPSVGEILNDLWQFSETPGKAKRRRV
jgi:hypothetical protein